MGYSKSFELSRCCKLLLLAPNKFFFYLTKVGGGYIAYNTNVRNFGGVSSKLPIHGSMRCNFVAAMSLCVLYISEMFVWQWS